MSENVRLRMPRSRVARAATGLAGGTGAAQLVSIAFALVNARLYSPFDVGVYGTVIGLSVVLTPVATLKLEAAVASASREEEAWGLIRLASICATSLGLVVFVLYLLHLTSDHATSWGGEGEWVFLGPVLFLSSLYAVFLQAALRMRRYGPLAVRGVVQSTVTGAAQAALCWLPSAWAGLFIGDIVGRIVAIGMLLPTVRALSRMAHGRGDGVGVLLRDHRGVILHYFPASLLDTVAIYAPLLVAAVWFGPHAAGEVTLTQRVLGSPLALIGASVGGVLLAEVSSNLRKGRPESRSLVLKSVRLLSMIAALVSAGIIAFAPQLFVLALGPQWAEAGHLARWLAIPLGVGIVWNPISSLFISFRRWRLFLIFAVARLGGSLGVGTLLHSLGVSFMPVVVGMGISVALVQSIGVRSAVRFTT